MRLHAPIVATAAALLFGAMSPAASPDAHAQWKWRDDQGRVHYSDRPPPTSVPASRIQRSDLAPAVAGAAASSPAGAASGAEREEQTRRRDAERDEERRKAEQLARQAAALAEACDGMRGEARTLESGMLLARVDARGERQPMSDDERAARLEAIRRDLQAHCPSS